MKSAQLMQVEKKPSQEVKSKTAMYSDSPINYRKLRKSVLNDRRFRKSWLYALFFSVLMAIFFLAAGNFENLGYFGIVRAYTIVVVVFMFSRVLASVMYRPPSKATGPSAPGAAKSRWRRTDGNAECLSLYAIISGSPLPVRYCPPVLRLTE